MSISKKPWTQRIGAFAILAFATGIGDSSIAQVQDVLPAKEDVTANFETDHFSPYAGRNFPTRVLWVRHHYTQYLENLCRYN